MRTLGEKALQQVDAALQGGQQCQQQAGAVSSGKTTAPAPQRSQADADLAMQMLLVSPVEGSRDCRWRTSAPSLLGRRCLLLSATFAVDAVARHMCRMRRSRPAAGPARRRRSGPGRRRRQSRRRALQWQHQQTPPASSRLSTQVPRLESTQLSLTPACQQQACSQRSKCELTRLVLW